MSKFTPVFLLVVLAACIGATKISVPQSPLCGGAGPGTYLLITTVPASGQPVNTCVTVDTNNLAVTGGALTLSAAVQAKLNATGPVGQTFQGPELPTGAIDGSNVNFSLSQPPNPASSLLIYRNGLLQQVNSDYLMSANTANVVIFFQAPLAGDSLQAFYRLQ